MANQHPPILSDLIDKLAKLPGLGKKSATRLALYFLRQSQDEVNSLADLLTEVKEQIKFCSICHNFTDQDPCPRCQDPRRDNTLLCIVETPGDLLAIEALGLFHGQYHVLGGALAPLSGIGPDDLKIFELFERLDKASQTAQPIKEILMATGSSPEGESTLSFLLPKLKERGLAVTRLARGVPIGVDLEYVDGATLKQALECRREM